LKDVGFQKGFYRLRPRPIPGVERPQASAARQLRGQTNPNRGKGCKGKDHKGKKGNANEQRQQPSSSSSGSRWRDNGWWQSDRSSSSSRYR
tara:strand:- start:87 stop:359 length:273 start_codon:yes stop_codon:yes gene_type:complete